MGGGRPTVQLLLAAAAGVVWALCFGRRAVVVVPWLALAPLLLLLGQRRAPLLGFVHGFAYWLAAVYWIGPTIETFGGLPRWMAAGVLVLLCAYLGSFHLLFAWLGSRLWRRGGGWTLVALPALWVAVEWFRGQVTSFPWNLAAYAWVEVPGALPLSAWIGPFGISFLVLVANTGLARAVAIGRPRPWLAAGGVCLVLLSWGGRWAAPAAAGAFEAGAPVRVVQPNIPNLVEWDPGRHRQDHRRLLALSRRACDVPGALVVWPESAAWPYGFDDPALRADVLALTGRGCDLILNSPTEAAAGHYNSALLVRGDGVAGRYDKQRLVPYGEYVPPIAAWIPGVGKVARAVGSFLPGERPALLDWAGERIGLSICFEVTFPGEVAAAVRRGATVLATITNDAWYGDTSAPWQHLTAARFRAAENRRPLLRAAITGVSGLIGADGAVVERLGVGEEGILRGRVTGGTDLTPAARAPWLVPVLCLLVAGFAIFRSIGS